MLDRNFATYFLFTASWAQIAQDDFVAIRPVEPDQLADFDYGNPTRFDPIIYGPYFCGIPTGQARSIE
jgi:hypothetical protein